MINNCPLSVIVHNTFFDTGYGIIEQGYTDLVRPAETYYQIPMSPWHWGAVRITGVLCHTMMQQKVTLVFNTVLAIIPISPLKGYKLWTLYFMLNLKA